MLGAGLMAVLVFMKGRFLWWPFHPIGFAVGFSRLVRNQAILSIFIAWLVKTVIMKYGGVKVYRKARFFFLGLILGQYVIAILWFVIDAMTGTVGNRVFYR